MTWVTSLSRHARGRWAEHRAKHYLCKQGLHFVTGNYRCNCGEIDLVMRDQNCWVFVEVKWRTSQAAGTAAEQVTSAKITRIEYAIAHFFGYHRINPNLVDHRIDVIAMEPGRLFWLKAIHR